jgi:hypothetical protein
MTAEPVPATLCERLVLAETIYGSIRNYEMWLLRHGRDVRDTDRQAVRRAFSEANQAMAAGDLKAAAKSLHEAEDRVKALKRPLAVATGLLDKANSPKDAELRARNGQEVGSWRAVETS